MASLQSQELKTTIHNFAKPTIKTRDYPKGIYFLFFLVALYVVLPLIDIPLLGLSLSAPLFGIITLFVIFRPVDAWLGHHRRWILLAILVWAGIFTSAMANGLISGGTNINSDGILNIIRYAYWLLVFVITIYFAGRGKVFIIVCKIFGWAIFVLSIARCVEGVIFGNIGAWTGTHLMTQNSYGYLFSTFSPFLLVEMIQRRGWKKALVVMGYAVFLVAEAINGSRGSWVAIGLGLGLCIILLSLWQPRRFIRVLISILILVGVASLTFASLPKIYTAFTNRLNSFQSLEEDKSYMIRQLMNQKSIKLFEESPIIGVGTSRYLLSTVPLEIPSPLQYGSQAYFDKKTSHNSFLSFLAENGLVGAVPFGILLLVLVFQGFKMGRKLTGRGEYWALAIFLSFIQMSIHMWANSSLTNTASWFTYGLVGSMIMIGQKKTP